jgi:glyoxylase-like metal-dependent hydrolase (beta-lactamase superfamily II)
MACRCLLIEQNDDVTLVDTGFGEEDCKDGGRMLPRQLRLLARPTFDPAETALGQSREIGFTAEKVSRILLTHLHVDHAGGLRDFPHAELHAAGAEYDFAMANVFSRKSYFDAQFTPFLRWRLVEKWDDLWHGFRAARLPVPFESYMVHLPGHTPGHCGVAVRLPEGSTWANGAGNSATPFPQHIEWLFHVGDAIYKYSQLDDQGGGFVVEAGCRYFANDNRSRIAVMNRLRQLRSAPVAFVCSHDSIAAPAIF